ncbi:hypothetical protein EMIT07CA2_140050 [Brevibacillus sp. IT-7CA2]|uniref:hypothetical protein n=1 Tax=Brevibacillus sp. IT-7CA2 TaxID=3026436 RepID=UPI0039E191FE
MPHEHVKIWVAVQEDVIVGTIQLHLVSRPNGLHRAEIARAADGSLHDTVLYFKTLE